MNRQVAGLPWNPQRNIILDPQFRPVSARVPPLVRTLMTIEAIPLAVNIAPVREAILRDTQMAVLEVAV